MWHLADTPWADADTPWANRAHLPQKSCTAWRTLWLTRQQPSSNETSNFWQISNMSWKNQRNHESIECLNGQLSDKHKSHNALSHAYPVRSIESETRNFHFLREPRLVSAVSLSHIPSIVSKLLASASLPKAYAGKLQSPRFRANRRRKPRIFLLQQRPAASMTLQSA